jgi:integral membrane sensor domain MASE1
LVAALVGGLCFATALLQFDFIRAQNLAVPFWAANAIALTALLRAPRSSWPSILVAAGLGLAGAGLAAHRYFPATSIYTFANLCEVTVATLLLRRGGQPFELAERNDVVRFILVCGICAPLVSASIASLASLVSPTGSALTKAVSWYLSNAMGLIIFTPALWLSEGARRAIAGDRKRLALFAGLTLLMAPVWVAKAYFPTPPLVILTLPILGYLALEFGVAGIALGILASVPYAFGAGLLAQQLHGAPEPLPNLLFKAEAFITCVAAFGLPLGAVVDDKKRIQDALINCLASGLVAENASPVAAGGETAVTAGLLDATGVFRLIARDGAPDPAIEALDGENLFERMTARDRRRVEAAFSAAISHDEGDASRRLHVSLELGVRSFSATLTLLSVRRGVAGEATEAMLLIETGARRPTAAARAA